MPYISHVFFKLPTSPFVYGMITYPMGDFGLEMVVVAVLPFGLLVNCTRQIMTCEPIDIIYFTLGTDNFDI